MILSDAWIAHVAYEAGFRNASLIDAVAIALAESGGNPSAVNTAGNQPPSRDRGLWQINSFWHPEVTDAQAFNPQECADAAYRISRNGTNFTPWSTFNSGSYRKFLHRATVAASQVGPTPSFTLHRYLQHTNPMLHGADVTALQHRVGCAADGWFGPVTDEHTKTFQSAHGLTADGIVGPVTARALGWAWAG